MERESLHRSNCQPPTTIERSIQNEDLPYPGSSSTVISGPAGQHDVTMVTMSSHLNNVTTGLCGQSKHVDSSFSSIIQYIFHIAINISLGSFWLHSSL